MSVNAAISMSYRNCSAGQNPPPMATLTIFNPNAVTVAVTGLQLQFYDTQGNPVRAPANLPEPLMGPGQNLAIAAGSSITLGPFPVAVGSAANANLASALAIGSTNNPMPRQLSTPEPMQLQLGGIVTASDGSSNDIAKDSVLVTYSARPPLYSQGGVAQFNGALNSNLVAAVF